MEPLKVVELFAGVGGFRIGLERASDRFRVVWSNQWEPGVKRQAASDVYKARFGADHHSNVDIALVPAKEIPAHDLLVGGFPCQDYSVARTLKQAAGLKGKKGVLWWEIHRILAERRPAYILLENVDRLLKSPIGQRGRDFAVMLASLADLGYVVEWRVINAADYGMPQRRRRVFFVAYHQRTGLGKAAGRSKDPAAWITEKGLIAEGFPCSPGKVGLSMIPLNGDLADISKKFNHARKGAKSPFSGAGVLIGRQAYTCAVLPEYDGPRITLGEVLLPSDQVPKEFFVPSRQVKDWKYFKGGKSERRVDRSNGFAYAYSEGAMAFPDPLDKPSRTIVTGEGGTSPSRFKHVVTTPEGRFRRLTPLELERLNMFPDGHTEGATDAKRAFFMGNALVTGVIERLGKALAERAK
ncbi:MAG: DNA (cytosine-5-)-methyltransferase [Flavobacteriales bacterium]|nr:DNA (cytosine-5-)-methyltransferase [Flavobacteriales bacterium]